MNAKQKLIREPRDQWRDNWRPAGIVTMALPFYRSRPGKLVHRVRSGTMHSTCGQYEGTHHIALRFWCGMHGFLGSRHRDGQLFATSPNNAIHCATCEGRAVGAGLDETRQINGRAVLYNTRV